MKIDKDTAVTMHIKVADANGRLLDAGADPVVYLHGGYDDTLPKIEAALQDQEPGYQVTLALACQDAFGEHDQALLKTIDKKDFPAGVKVGGQLRGRSDDGRTRVFTVVKIKGPLVYLDGNHALAGKDLRFTIKVLAVRAATEEEIAHRHVHGEHGHHH